MDSRTLGIITLLRSALKNEALSLPDDFSWDGVANIIYEHHLVGMAVRGAARCSVPRTTPALKYLTALFCKDITTSRFQMKRLFDIYSAFEENGIEYMPIKGAVIKPLYPQSELRTMGDADVLIRHEQYPEIKKILLSLGFSVDVESDHEYVWKDGDFTLELHKRLIPSYNKDYYSYYGDGWRLARKSAQGSAYCLSPEDHFIYLVVHFAKHYRDGSISAKNVCDFYVYKKAHPDMDKAYLDCELEKLRLSEFYRNVLDLLDTWFEGKKPTEAVEIITETAFKGGIFSQEESALAVSVIKLRDKTSSLSGVKRKAFLKGIFPPKSALINRYPILSKAPFLLPLIWIVRGFEIVFLHPERRKNSIDASQKLMNVSCERIEEYEARLRSVGLDFNFDG